MTECKALGNLCSAYYFSKIIRFSINLKENKNNLKPTKPFFFSYGLFYIILRIKYFAFISIAINFSIINFSKSFIIRIVL